MSVFLNSPEAIARAKGSTLIEALIALLVVSFGLLGLAGFEAKLLAGTGVSKARAEAIALAERKIETLRNVVKRSQFDNNVTPTTAGSESVTGVNASFSLVWAVCSQELPIINANPNSRDFVCPGTSLPLASEGIVVRVSWTDAKTGGTEQVTLNGISAWNNPGSSLMTASGGPTGGNTVRSPTGGAKAGKGTTRVTGNSPGGSVTTVQGTDGKIYLQKDGLTVLTATGGSDFSSVSGRVYIDTDVSVNASDVYVLTSDAAYCEMGEPQNVGSSYTYMAYKCFFGPGWYGKIGVVRTDTANTNDRVCQGDQSVTSPTLASSIYSKVPQLATVRDYRGFVCTLGTTSAACANGGWQQLGIGQTPVRNASGVPTSYTYTPRNYPADGATGEDHHFLITRLTGSPDDSRCGAKLIKDGTNEFVGNAGKMFCLKVADRDDACPEAYPQESSPKTTVTLAYSDSSRIGAVSIDGGGCDTGSVTSCYLDWTGWIGSTWSGQIAITPKTTGTGSKICASSGGVVVTYVGGTGTPAQPSVTGGGGAGTPLVLSFTEIPPSLTSISITGITAVAGNAACP